MRYADPTGHRCVEDGYEGSCNSVEDQMTKKWENDKIKKRIRNATIRIGFGNSDIAEDGSISCPALAPRTDGGKSCTGGLGTFVGDNSTIYTAWHNYDNAIIPSLFYYRSPDGTLNATSDFTYEHINGTDVMIIHLSVPLNGFVPAEMAQPNTFQGGEDVSVAYQDESHDLHVYDTHLLTDNTYLPGAYGSLKAGVYNRPDSTSSQNYPFILNAGDSGGGVFYNGYFVGVTSFISPPGLPETMWFEQP